MLLKLINFILKKNLNKKKIITTTTNMGFDKDFILIEKDSDTKRIKNILKNFFLIKVGKK